MLHRHCGLSYILRAYIKSQGSWHTIVIRTQGGSGGWEAVEVRLADLRGLLASQSSLLGKFQAEGTISNSIDGPEE